MDPLIPRLTGAQLARLMTTSTQARNRIQGNANLMAKVRGSKRYHNEARERANNRRIRAAAKREFTALARNAAMTHDPNVGRQIIHFLKTHNKNDARLVDSPMHSWALFGIYGIQGHFETTKYLNEYPPYKGRVKLFSPYGTIKIRTHEPTIFTKRNRNYFSTGGRNLRNVFTNHVD